MERLTHKRANGIKTGYWSPNKKQELVDRLAAYENTGLEPEDIKVLVDDVIKVNQMLIQEWIPCNERLPEEGENVLCTDGKYIYLIEYDADIDAGFGDIDEIIAWQPLPEPYKGEETAGE